MRRQERALAADAALKIVQEGTWGVLSTVSPLGEPYGVPLNYVYDATDNSIVFHCAREGKKLENIRATPAVSFTITAYETLVPQKFTTYYESAILSGQAVLIEDAAEKARLLTLLCDRLAPEAAHRDSAIENSLSVTAVCKISISALTGKRNGG